MISLLLSQWRTAAIGGLCLALAALFALWRLEAGHAQRLAQEAAAARSADRVDQAETAASRAAASVVSQGAERDVHTLNLHMENAHALESAPGFGESLDPELNAAGRRGLCGFQAYADDPDCVQLRGAHPGRGPQAGGADGPAGP